jgi:hypothetical protein
MADIFYAAPTSTTYTPLSPASKVVIEDIVTPIVPIRTGWSTSYNSYNSYNNLNLNPGFTLSNIPILPRVVSGFGVSHVFNPTRAYYYDSGIGENPFAQHQTNEDLRYKFLDKWLVEDYQDILKMLRVDGNSVKVLSKDDSDKNDISKDSVKVIEQKIDFIGYEILTLHKNKKILDALCAKNNLKYYDLPHNSYFVKKAQAKYVKSKLEEMRK